MVVDATPEGSEALLADLEVPAAGGLVHALDPLRTPGVDGWRTLWTSFAPPCPGGDRRARRDEDLEGEIKELVRGVRWRGVPGLMMGTKPRRIAGLRWVTTAWGEVC